MIFDDPYVQRVYPSPTIGRGIEVYVKELPLSSSADFVMTHFEEVYAAGDALFCADSGGMRAWNVEENVSCFERHGCFVEEHPWSEVWWIPGAEIKAVLDVIMYTEFYDEHTMERYADFRSIVDSMLEAHQMCVTQAGNGGVGLRIVSSISDDAWTSAFNQMYSFNKRHFTVDQPRQSLEREFRKRSNLFFGYT